ncbi:unnamed protein product [Rotaria sp. Silwood2]|nr:unnamed protein product [Rotaria sp. Silwood2]
MANTKKKFEACLLRTTTDVLIVAEWHQLATTTDKAKLTVGSCVGYKESTKKRGKIIRGTIVITGELLYLRFHKVQESNFDEEEESTDVQGDKNLLDSDDEHSTDSNDGCLNIDEQEEICDDDNPKAVEVEPVKNIQFENKSPKNKTNVTTSNPEHIEENSKKTCSSSNKRIRSEDETEESPVSKRTNISLARFDEMEMENKRLKKEVKMYQEHWMPRPTDPSVIRYFIGMAEILTSSGENQEKKEEKMEAISETLSISDAQLIRLQKENGTKTARSIVRACYPRSVRCDTNLEDIDDDFRQAIFVEKCEQLNEELSHRDAVINFIDESIETSASPIHEEQINFDNSLLSNSAFQNADKSCIYDDEQNTLNTSKTSSIRPIEKIDLASALASLKTRHSLSAVCINDICSLLCLLNVPDAPRSWFQVKKALNKSFVSPLDRKIWWICPSCKKAADNAFKCSDPICSWCFAPPASIPLYFYTFNIREQINSILAITTDIYLPKHTKGTSFVNLPMRDIFDGAHYNKLLDKESGKVLTLTMNTDGIQPYNSTGKSIWPVTFVINEVKRNKRFLFQNLILGGIWPGPMKPKRFEMSAFLETIVVQLKELEQGSHFECRSGASFVRQFLKVFLICTCMDKPAQALVQNLPEPTAQFGCGRCEIRGEDLVMHYNSFI